MVLSHPSNYFPDRLASAGSSAELPPKNHIRADGRSLWYAEYNRLSWESLISEPSGLEIVQFTTDYLPH